MRDDQRQKIKELTERLADRFILDADPATWAAGEKQSSDMSQQERGDSYWSRKMAMATGGVLRYALDLGEKINEQQAMPGTAEHAAREADMDRAIREAERRAAHAVQRVIGDAKAKAAFDRKTHGKKAAPTGNKPA